MVSKDYFSFRDIKTINKLVQLSLLLSPNIRFYVFKIVVQTIVHSYCVLPVSLKWSSNK